MIKKLLLAGAFALTMLSGSYAQVDKVVDSSYFTKGDANVYGTGTNGDFGTATLDGNGNVVIPCTKTTNPYDAINLSVLSGGNPAVFPFPDMKGRPRTIKLFISASPATTVRVAVQDNNGYTTDANVPVVNATPTMQVLTATFDAGTFVSKFNGGLGCSTTSACLVDSTVIANIQIDPNPGSNYTGTLTIGWIYAGDSLAQDVVITSPSQVSSSIVTGSTYTLSASSNIGLDSLSFWDGSTRLGGATAAPYNLTWNNVPQGKHVIKAIGYKNLQPYTSIAVDTIYANGNPTITGLPPVGANGLTVTSDSGFYSRGDASVFSYAGTGEYSAA